MKSRLAAPTGPASSSGPWKDVSIYDMPPSQRQQLCDHLDELNVWYQLATAISLRQADVQNIRRQQSRGNSAADELLKIWGDQYNHTVTELFVLFWKHKLFQAMRIIKNSVKAEYRTLIPDSQPALSVIMAKGHGNSQSPSRKILNCQSSSGVSNSNNNMDTSDNNYTTSKSESEQSGQQHSTYLSLGNVKEYASSITEIDYDELTAATNNWADNAILGKGGFGTVFRGYWKHTPVAIKQIHYKALDERESVKVQIQQSMNELKYLNSCRHDNVLPLYGYSLKGDKPCLVYQLMTEGSLDQRLNTKKLPPLSCQQKINICLGTARGINFLHTRGKPLIHGDIKPPNILLDQCLQPKIGDFGLAREGPKTINSAVEVSQVFGTKPYLPPEFLHSKKLSTQVDTYSFGVVLLETFTGLRAYDKNRANPLLTKHVTKMCAMPNSSIEQLVDKNAAFLPGELEVCIYIIQLGLKCIADSPQDRPQMERVLESIETLYNYSHSNQ